MIYVLLALALLAGLTVVLSRGASTGSDDLTKEKSELLITGMVAYAGSAKNAVDQMLMSGTPVANLDFLKPTDAGFEDPPFHNRVLHPNGGGLSDKSPDPTIFTSADAYPQPRWYLERMNNIEWTPTPAPDVLLVAYGISQPLCEGLNKKITGSTDIPVVGDIAEELFVDTFWGGGANSDVTVAVCPDCEGWPTLCVTDGTEYVYYNIISGQ